MNICTVYLCINMQISHGYSLAAIKVNGKIFIS